MGRAVEMFDKALEDRAHEPTDAVGEPYTMSDLAECYVALDATTKPSTWRARAHAIPQRFCDCGGREQRDARTRSRGASGRSAGAIEEAEGLLAKAMDLNATMETDDLLPPSLRSCAADRAPAGRLRGSPPRAFRGAPPLHRDRCGWSMRARSRKPSAGRRKRGQTTFRVTMARGARKVSTPFFD